MEVDSALLCIPDLTGFTKFMIEADIDFSKKVVPPLLRTIINANILNLKVAEIEGDAVLFYRFGETPSFSDTIEQCQNFFICFETQLKDLRKAYPDEFKKYVSSKTLGLKMIFHQGEIIQSNIEGRVKLIGEDVITAHKLLKNHVPYSEYILFSEQFLSCFDKEEINESLNWAKLESGQDEYDHIGKVKYKFIDCKNFLKSTAK